MTGMLKTYTKNDVKVTREDNKNNIDSYNPSTSSRELNPYWKDGGSGLPQSHESFRKSRQFMKPSDDDDYYTKPLSNQDKQETRNKHEHKYDGNEFRQKASNWRKDERREEKQDYKSKHDITTIKSENIKDSVSLKGPSESEKGSDSLYLSDEKMNKLAAKIVKAEIMGDTKLVNELGVKLEAAREYRKQNSGVGKDDNGIMLMTTTAMGNSRPLSKADSSHAGDPRSKGGKRKAETHNANERVKYFGNDDKYNLSQMVSINIQFGIILFCLCCQSHMSICTNIYLHWTDFKNSTTI